MNGYCGIQVDNGIMGLKDCRGVVKILHDGMEKTLSCKMASKFEVVGTAIIEYNDRKCHVISDVQCLGSPFEESSPHVIDCDYNSASWWLNVAFYVMLMASIIILSIALRYHVVMAKLKVRIGDRITRKWTMRGLNVQCRERASVPVHFSFCKILMSLVFCRTLFDYGDVQITEACTNFGYQSVNGLHVYTASFSDKIELCVRGSTKQVILPSMMMITPESYRICSYELSSMPEETCGQDCYNDCNRYENGINICNGGIGEGPCREKTLLSSGHMRSYRKYCVIHNRSFFACLGETWGCWKWVSSISVNVNNCYIVKSLWSEELSHTLNIVNLTGLTTELLLTPDSKILGASSQVLVLKGKDSWLCDSNSRLINNMKLFRRESSWDWDFNWDSQSCHVKEKESDGLCTSDPNFSPDLSDDCTKLPLRLGSYDLVMAEDHKFWVKPAGLWHVRINSGAKIDFTDIDGVCSNVSFGIMGKSDTGKPFLLMASANSLSGLETTVYPSCLPSGFSFPCDGNLHTVEVSDENCIVGGEAVKSYITDRLHYGSVEEHVNGEVIELSSNTVTRMSTMVIIFMIIILIVAIRCIFSK